MTKRRFVKLFMPQFASLIRADNPNRNYAN